MAENPDNIKTLVDFLATFYSIKTGQGVSHLYRGHAKYTFSLTPSLFRIQANRKHEKNILRELIAIRRNEFKEDQSTFERLVRMQHFSLPARLLDLTYNALVALYFACASERHMGISGKFIIITTPSEQIKYFDSDTVSC